MYCPIESCKSQLNYEPEKWNSLDKNAHEINNCYSYAFDRVEKNIIKIHYN